MIPSRRLVMAAALPVVLALAALFDGTLLWPMLGLDAAIAVVALVDLFLGASRLVHARRTVTRVLSVGAGSRGRGAPCACG